MVGPTSCRRNVNRVTTPKLPPPPRSAQNRSAFSSRLARADLAVGGDDLDLLQVVHRPAEATRQVAQAAAERQAGDADLGDEAEPTGGQSVRLCRPVDVPEQTARADVREPRVRVDGDVAHARHVERQTALGDRGSGHVVAPALDAQQQTRGHARSRRPQRRRRPRSAGGRAQGPSRPCRSRSARPRPSPRRPREAPGPRPASRARRAAPPSASRDRRRVRRRRWCSPSCAGRRSARAGELSLLLLRSCRSSRCRSAPRTPLARRRLAGFGQLSGRLPSWPKTAGTLDVRCDDERHRRGLRELLPAERQP